MSPHHQKAKGKEQSRSLTEIEQVTKMRCKSLMHLLHAKILKRRNAVSHVLGGTVRR